MLNIFQATADFVLSNIHEMANSKNIIKMEIFYKSGPGEYSENEQFIGVSVPNIRKLVASIPYMELDEVNILLHSQYNEVRLAALLILIKQFHKSEIDQQEVIVDFYLDNLNFVNNWNLVDSSAPQILGTFLFKKEKSILFELAQSENLWHRRISILSNLYDIRHNEFKSAIEISKLLINDSHDLIHKAVGWMLREIGKRDMEVELAFLNKFRRQMPRTMLRYAIEKFPKELRSKLLLK